MTDYISREMTIDAICRLCNANFEEEPCEPSECEMMSLLCKIPAADVREVVRSKWIKMKFFPDWECEKCGSVISGNTPDPWNHYHFCPNCGADMRIFSTNCKNTVTTGGKT